MMQRRTLLCLVLSVAALSGQACADYLKGQQAYDAGRYAEALPEFQTSFRQGDMRAAASLGVMYRNGQGVPRNVDLAKQRFTQAAQSGNAKAQNGLGNLLKEGQGVRANRAAALRWYQKAAAQGYPPAIYNVGLWYSSAGDDAAAAQWYTTAATLNYPAAQINLGNLYLDGKGVGKDAARAIALFQAAADQRAPMAFIRLGTVYKDGLGVAKNYAKAAKYFEQPATLGDVYSQASLGWLSYQTRQYQEAFVWSDLAARQGDKYAQHTIGILYEGGFGTAQDLGRAGVWYQKSAAQGYPLASARLGHLLLDQKKYPEAFKYNAFAAQRGNAYGQGQLGYMYEAGLATRKSLDSAVKWYRLAAQQGDPYSISRLKELGK